MVKAAIENKKLVAGICNASVFLGMNGFLNNVILYALDADTLQKIERSYRLNKIGVWEVP